MCSKDAGRCIGQSCEPTFCGDLICQADESCSTCKEDCGRWSDSCEGTAYYASPEGGGDGTSADTPFKIADFNAVAQPGDTLLVLDGTYVGVESMIQLEPPLNGLKGSPITIRALNDGQAIIDGQGQHQPINISSDWIIVEGFNAHSAGRQPQSNAGMSVVSIWGGNNNVIRRVVAWDAAEGNTNVFGVHRGSDNLLEDVAGFGTARKVFSTAKDGNRTTIRRCFARWEGEHSHGPKIGLTTNYDSEGRCDRKLCANLGWPKDAKILLGPGLLRAGLRTFRRQDLHGRLRRLPPTIDIGQRRQRGCQRPTLSRKCQRARHHRLRKERCALLRFQLWRYLRPPAGPRA